MVVVEGLLLLLLSGCYSWGSKAEGVTMQWDREGIERRAGQIRMTRKRNTTNGGEDESIVDRLTWS